MLGLAQSSLAKFTSSHRDHTVTNYCRHCASETPMCTTLPHVEVLRAYQNQDSQPAVNNLDQYHRFAWTQCLPHTGSLMNMLLDLRIISSQLVGMSLLGHELCCTLCDFEAILHCHLFYVHAQTIRQLVIMNHEVAKKMVLATWRYTVNVRYDWMWDMIEYSDQCHWTASKRNNKFSEIYNKFVNPNTAFCVVDKFNSHWPYVVLTKQS